ncbi:putative cytochrome P450 CYP13A8 [Aphelenchoides fujianensis]|nr:putative cytochrome P450 CYP13A8 [Aphelenchoides fujianensis]
MILLLLLLLVVGVVVAAWQHKSYWKRRGVPGPESELFFGALRLLGRSNDKPWPHTMHEWSKQYGRFYGLQKGWRNCLVISDHKMANEVMSSNFEVFHERDHAPIAGNVERDPVPHVFSARGQNWRRLRALSSPAFSVQNLKKILPTVEYCSNEAMRFLEEKVDAGKPFNICTHFHEYTMDVIYRVALGQTDNQQFGNPFTKSMLQAMHEIEDFFLMLSWIAPITGETLKWIQYGSAFLTKRRAFIDVVMMIKKNVEERKSKRAAGDVREENIDFIDMFLDAESDEVETTYKEGTFDKKNINIMKKMTTGEVMGQCMVFLLAGFDTTANTLAFTAYYLAKNPEVQEKLRRETEEFCVKPTPTYEELAKLKYSDAVMKETLRFQPIAGIITSRKCVRDTMLGGELHVEKGTNVILDVLSLHFDPKVWGDDVHEYNPDRWLREDAPFGSFYGFVTGFVMHPEHVTVKLERI